MTQPKSCHQLQLSKNSTLEKDVEEPRFEQEAVIKDEEPELRKSKGEDNEQWKHQVTMSLQQ